MDVPWSQFLIELQNSRQDAVTMQLYGKGTFVKFRSKITSFESPSPFPLETMAQFSVVPYYVTLRFENGVHVNLYMRHIEEVVRKDGAVVVLFKSDDSCGKYSITFNMHQRTEDKAG